MPTDIDHVTLDDLDLGLPYSTVTVANGFLFVSGQIPESVVERAESRPVEQQIRDVITSISTALRAAESSLHSIVKATCYLANAEDFATLNRVYGECMPAPYPARTTVIAGIAAPGVLFEMDAIAVPDRPHTT